MLLPVKMQLFFQRIPPAGDGKTAIGGKGEGALLQMGPAVHQRQLPGNIVPESNVFRLAVGVFCQLRYLLQRRGTAALQKSGSGKEGRKMTDGIIRPGRESRMAGGAAGDDVCAPGTGGQGDGSTQGLRYIVKCDLCNFVRCG